MQSGRVAAPDAIRCGKRVTGEGCPCAGTRLHSRALQCRATCVRPRIRPALGPHRVLPTRRPSGRVSSLVAFPPHRPVGALLLTIVALLARPCSPPPSRSRRGSLRRRWRHSWRRRSDRLRPEALAPLLAADRDAAVGRRGSRQRGWRPARRASWSRSVTAWRCPAAERASCSRPSSRPAARAPRDLAGGRARGIPPAGASRASGRSGSIEGLHRLQLDTDPPLHGHQPARQRRGPRAGAAERQRRSPPTCPGGVTAVVLMGRGEMVFPPAPDVERGQVKLYAGRRDAAHTVRRRVPSLNPANSRALLRKGARARRRPIRAQLRTGRDGIPRERRQLVQRGPRGSQPRVLVARAVVRRLPRGGADAAVRHAHLHAIRQRARRHLAVQRTAAGTFRFTRRRPASRAAVRSSTRTMSSRSTCWTTTSTRRSPPQRQWFDARARLRVRVRDGRRGVLDEPEARGHGRRCDRSRARAGRCCSCACATRTASS